jgi:ketol-acid reductoisomerase
MSTEQVSDVDFSYFKNKTVAILGYGDNGKDHAHRLRNEGIQVVVALRHDVPSDGWKEQGFRVVSVYEAIDEADVIQVW